MTNRFCLGKDFVKKLLKRQKAFSFTIFVIFNLQLIFVRNEEKVRRLEQDQNHFSQVGDKTGEACENLKVFNRTKHIKF